MQAKKLANTICPGGVYSDQDPKFVENYCSNIPIGKMAKSSDLGGRSALFVLKSPTYYRVSNSS